MCIAIAIFSGKPLERGVARNCWANNSDGAGFCFTTGERVVIKKGYMKFDDFWEAYESYDLTDCPHLIHFRIQTSGKTDRMNTHPWRVTKRMAMIHNGILRFPHTKQLSDTGNFVKTFVRPIALGMGEEYVMYNESLHEAIYPMMSNSKLVFLDHFGGISILNDKAGEWDNQIEELQADGSQQKRYERWYSNISYKRNRYSGYSYHATWGTRKGKIAHPPLQVRWISGNHLSTECYRKDEELFENGWVKHPDGSWDAPPGWVDPDEQSKQRTETFSEKTWSIDDDGNLVDDFDDDEKLEEWELFNNDLEKECLEAMEEEDHATESRAAAGREMNKRYVLKDGGGKQYSLFRSDVSLELKRLSGLSWEVIERLNDTELSAAAEEFGVFELSY